MRWQCWNKNSLESSGTSTPTPFRTNYLSTWTVVLLIVIHFQFTYSTACKLLWVMPMQQEGALAAIMLLLQSTSYIYIFCFRFWFILDSANCRCCGANKFFCPALNPSIKPFLPPPLPSSNLFFLPPSLHQTFSSSHPPSLCVSRCKFYNLKKTVCERVLFHRIDDEYITFL